MYHRRTETHKTKISLPFGSTTDVDAFSVSPVVVSRAAFFLRVGGWSGAVDWEGQLVTALRQVVIGIPKAAVLRHRGSRGGGRCSGSLRCGFSRGSFRGRFGRHPRRLRRGRFGRNSGGLLSGRYRWSSRGGLRGGTGGLLSGRYRWSSRGGLRGGTGGLRGRRHRSGRRGGRHRRRRGGRVGQILDAVIVRLTRVCHLAAFQLGGIERTTAVGWQWKGVDAFAGGPLRAVVGIPHGRAGRGRAGRRRCGRGRGGDVSGDLARTRGLTQVGGAAAIRGGQVRGGVAAGRLGT